MKIDILDGSGATVASYSSNRRPPQQRGGFGGFFRRGPPPPMVTTEQGFNRMVWDVKDADGLTVPPGSYQAKMTVGGASQTQPFKVLIDPRVAEGGVTVADLEYQYKHNKMMNAMVAESRALVRRVQDAMKSADGAMQTKLAPVAEALLTPEIRYSKPGLADHISYLARMTTGADQKVGNDAIERAKVLRKELDALEAKANAVLGTGN